MLKIESWAPKTIFKTQIILVKKNLFMTSEVKFKKKKVYLSWPLIFDLAYFTNDEPILKYHLISTNSFRNKSHPYYGPVHLLLLCASLLMSLSLLRVCFTRLELLFDSISISAKHKALWCWLSYLIISRDSCVLMMSALISQSKE